MRFSLQKKLKEFSGQKNFKVFFPAKILITFLTSRIRKGILHNKQRTKIPITINGKSLKNFPNWIIIFPWAEKIKSFRMENSWKFFTCWRCNFVWFICYTAKSPIFLIFFQSMKSFPAKNFKKNKEKIEKK